MPAPMPRRACVLVILMAVPWPDGGAAHASGFQLREQSADAMGNAIAGSTAKADDLSTLFYNPAGMARLTGNQAGAGVAWIAPTSRFSGGATAGGAPVAGSDGGDHARSTAVGSAYVLWDMAPDWRLGIAVVSPFGMRSDYAEDWVGRYQALDTRLTTLNASPSIAYRVNDSLSVAAGLQIAYIDAVETNAINFGAVVPGAGDGVFRVSGDDVALGWTASLLYQFSPASRLGLSYRSSVRHPIRGQAQFQGVPAALAGTRTFADSATDVVITLPDTATLGLYHDLSPQWAVMSDVSWTRWSVFRDLRLGFDSGAPDLVDPQNWHDTWFLSLGVTYRPEEHLSLHAGAAYDRAAVGDQFRNARLPDADRYWLSLGIGYEPSPRHRLSLAYTHIFADSVAIDHTAADPLGGRLTGSYDSHVDVVSASYTLRF